MLAMRKNENSEIQGQEVNEICQCMHCNSPEGKQDDKKMVVVVFSACQFSISLFSRFQRFDSNIK